MMVPDPPDLMETSRRSPRARRRLEERLPLLECPIVGAGRAGRVREGGQVGTGLGREPCPLQMIGQRMTR